MVSAASWAIAMDGEILFSKGAGEVRQIASLTKVMTAIVVLENVAKDPKQLEQIVRVSHRASIIFGTSALLEEGDRLTVEDLLYALLLPSGNDAAIVLSEFYGRRMHGKTGQDAMTRFLAVMNRKADSLGLAQTTFVDVHGMGENLSTARDLLELADVAMENPIFQKVVAAESYSSPVRTKRATTREMRWKNTNNLLGEFNGIKTGHTNTAGGCLLLSGEFNGALLRVVVLDSSNKRTRFRDAYNLLQWALYRTTEGG